MEGVISPERLFEAIDNNSRFCESMADGKGPSSELKSSVNCSRVGRRNNSCGGVPWRALEAKFNTFIDGALAMPLTEYSPVLLTSMLLSLVARSIPVKSNKILFVSRMSDSKSGSRNSSIGGVPIKLLELSMMDTTPRFPS